MIHELPHANIHAYEGKKVRYARVAPDKKKFFRRLVSIDLTIFTICILTYFVINTLSPSRLENVTYMLMRG